ncbi:diaminobutyrate--2-oxoglutarate transaminase [Neptunomonas phycophila]|uniref:diaminobutyrate--2-oxoglutarate transaminase n=1 Tax=Neptunomonas phycophila TaxID=1572645 RepID=UPI001BE9EEF6|nr:diaminobutyrate--2-oxoglutarate transaminase [Neptunomonas phycophila]MBT3145065.1 diaminobutyrate--2-oxoglutarate transaminase [Neptunomonas phycophila]
MTTFTNYESEVRGYCRSFPVTFDHAKGATLYSEGREYIDFLAGAGSLNYGHNNPVMKQTLLNYIEADGITHGLDMHSVAKEEFIRLFQEKILQPRKLNDYVMQFTGPTGANAVEAALKLARKVKGRENIIAFTNGFHGVTAGALSCTANQHHRGAAGHSLNHVDRMPFDGYLGTNTNTLTYVDKMLSDPSSGIDKPAAVILETIQGEGGLNTASDEWLKGLRKLCDKHDMLMIVDDIQAGCGRSGDFFSFESAGIQPDIITLSKSLSGYGLPLAVTVFRKSIDEWKPGEHNGTFRGNNHAFVTASAAIETYWSDDSFSKEVKAKADLLKNRLQQIARRYGPESLTVRGRGMMTGIVCPNEEIASKIVAHAFEQNLIIETCGNHDQVVKCFCPLTISEEQLLEGLSRLDNAFALTMADYQEAQQAS